jgi:hypothetical protein
VAAGRTQASATGIAADPRSRVAAVVTRHERTLLHVARQASLCHDDALDAYQRALEIYVRRVDTVDPATEVAWLKVVSAYDATQRPASASSAGPYHFLRPGASGSAQPSSAATRRPAGVSPTADGRPLSSAMRSSVLGRTALSQVVRLDSLGRTERAA